jgi:hypothetical protein
MNKSASMSLDTKRRFSNRQPSMEVLEDRRLMSDVVNGLGLVTDNSNSPLLRSSVVVLSQPAVNPANGTFSVTVGVENGSGNLVPNDSRTGRAGVAHIAIDSGPAGAVLSSAMTETINSDGTMTFSGLSVSISGAYSFDIADYTPVASVVTGIVNLPASAAATSSATINSDPVQMVSGAPGQIVILNQPQFNSADGTFSVSVQLKDANGNPIASSSSNPVGEARIEIASGPSGSFVTLYGDSADSAANSKTDGYAEAVVNPDGTSTFSGITVSTAGTYTFKISDATPSASIITASVDLSPPPANGPVNVIDIWPVTNVPVGQMLVSPVIIQSLPSTPPQAAASEPNTASTQLTPKALRLEKIAEAKLLKANKLAAAKQLKAQRLGKIAELRAARKAAAAAKAVKESTAGTDLIGKPLG